MKTTVLAALAAATLAVTAVVPAYAVDPAVQFRVTRIRSATPSCADHPGAPVVGRISGFMGIPAGRSVGFEGCFGTVSACDFWRWQVSGEIDGRIIYDRCEQR